MNAYYPERVSPRNAQGYDAGSIHAGRPVNVDRGRIVGYSTIATRYYLTACGRTIGEHGVALHDIGPTCKRCKAAIR